MSEKDELDSLRGEVAALQDIIISTIRAIDGRAVRYSSVVHHPPAVPLKLVDSVIGELDVKLASRPTTHVPNTPPREAKERTAYADALIKIKKAFEG